MRYWYITILGDYTMGFFNWFLAKPAVKPAHSAQTDIHSTLADATRPFMPGGAKAAAAPLSGEGVPASRTEQRRTERNARRELLFQVVRESMVRVGVLSSAFKFKVLALDQRGRTFLVMIDLSAEFAGETNKLAEIEALISQSAKNRFELVVQAVYWRFYETAASAAANRPGAAGAHSPQMGVHSNSRPVPLSAQPYPMVPSAEPVRTAAQGLQAPLASALPVSALVPPPLAKVAPDQADTQVLFARTVAQPREDVPARSTADPLDHDEVEAFKRALASGAQPGLSIPLGGATPAAYTAAQAAKAALAAAPAAAAQSMAAAAAAKAASMAAIRNKLLLTGYEDTEMPDPDAPILSATQYGELR